MRHIPDTRMILTSDPPQYYCNDGEGNRNPCYCHQCNWWGWAPATDKAAQRMSDDELLGVFLARGK
jgi:hypothetical protein